MFISLFALDIFDEQLGFWGTIVGLLMYLIPSILLTIALIIAWYVVFMQGFYWAAYVIIAGLPALIGLLFLAGWIWRKGN